MEPALPNPEALIYLHLPRTAGTTLISIIKRQYPMQATFYADDIDTHPKDLADLPVNTRAALRCVMGHLLYGVHRLLPQPSSYITLLRDPVDRIISHYYYVKSHPRHDLYRTIINGNLSLLEYATGGIDPDLINGQARYISGMWNRVNNSNEMLEQAQHNLSHSFTAFGPSERFDEVLSLFRRRLGWQDTKYVRQNVTAHRPRKEDIDAATLKRIAEYNELDMALYEWSLRRFDEQLRQNRIR